MAAPNSPACSWRSPRSGTPDPDRILVLERVWLAVEQATGSIHGFIGLLAGRSSHCATVEELNEAAAALAATPGLGRARRRPEPYRFCY